MLNWLILKITHKTDFEIYHVARIFNFHHEVVENQYAYGGS